MGLDVETASTSGGMQKLRVGKGPYPSTSPLHLVLSLRCQQLISTRPACRQDQDTRTHHDGHTGEEHSRKKLPDPGEVQRGKLLPQSQPRPQGTLGAVWGGHEQCRWNPEPGPVMKDLTHTQDTKPSKQDYYYSVLLT